MRTKKFFTYLCTALLVLSLATPVQGRIKEKVVIFNATTGHDHDGSAGGKLVYLPAIAITDVNVCPSQVCQLALTAEEGDVCVRSDEDKSYIHNGGVVEDMTDWTLLLSTGLVTSVNGDIGAVVNVERTTRLQTTISDSDSNYATSGAVVDYTASEISTHISSASAHHSSTSDTLAITPSTVNTTGDVTIGSGAAGVDYVLTFDGEDNDGSITFDEDTPSFIFNNQIEALTFVAPSGYFFAEQTTDTQAFGTKITGDTWWRWRTRTGGTFEWGSGSGARDTNLYRSGVASLKTDGDYYVGENALIASSGGLFSSSSTGFRILGTDDGAFFKQDATTTDGIFMYSDITSEAIARFLMDNSGVMYWGSGAATRDTNLYRGGANILQTSDTFKAPTLTSTNTAANITHATTTKYMTIAAASFEGVATAISDMELWGSSAFMAPLTTGNTSYCFSGVSLPHGAVVTRIDGYGSTNSGVSNLITVTLQRIVLTSNSNSAMASVSFSNGGTTGNDISITNATIDNTTYMYRVTVTGYATASASADANFYGIKITYTTANLSQTM